MSHHDRPTEWRPVQSAMGPKQREPLILLQASQRRRQRAGHGGAPAKTWKELQAGVNHPLRTVRAGQVFEAGLWGFQWEGLEHVFCPMFSNS